MSMTMRDSDAAMDGLRFPVLATIIVITSAIDLRGSGSLLHGGAAFAAAACNTAAWATTSAAVVPCVKLLWII
jgi:hypothetical protein